METYKSFRGATEYFGERKTLILSPKNGHGTYKLTLSEIFQTCIFKFHVSFQGCIIFQVVIINYFFRGEDLSNLMCLEHQPFLQVAMFLFR